MKNMTESTHKVRPNTHCFNHYLNLSNLTCICNLPNTHPTVIINIIGCQIIERLEILQIGKTLKFVHLWWGTILLPKQLTRYQSQQKYQILNHCRTLSTIAKNDYKIPAIFIKQIHSFENILESHSEQSMISF